MSSTLVDNAAIELLITSSIFMFLSSWNPIFFMRYCSISVALKIAWSFLTAASCHGSNSCGCDVGGASECMHILIFVMKVSKCFSAVASFAMAAKSIAGPSGFATGSWASPAFLCAEANLLSAMRYLATSTCLTVKVAASSATLSTLCASSMMRTEFASFISMASRESGDSR
ncbi:enterobactin synthase subunit F, putative [Babesia ovata]|uniref:Enterobactin synthase subunit F, putative n=1 Tax=Babesia ovata TaxID=189622 RepID=A0A2H6K6M5_9APIC|nr:enterobactin synthase subunit F, putative [Babesia ovata]GBE58654.1 enterobactin synthase subunit F, putative [Babesia ovata]